MIRVSILVAVSSDTQAADENRDAFIEWLKLQDDFYISWVEVQYDDDEGDTRIIRDSDHVTA